MCALNGLPDSDTTLHAERRHCSRPGADPFYEIDSKLDPVYRSAVQEAIAAGVRVKAVSVAWDGPAASLARELPVVWD